MAPKQLEWWNIDGEGRGLCSLKERSRPMKMIVNRFIVPPTTLCGYYYPKLFFTHLNLINSSYSVVYSCKWKPPKEEFDQHA